MAQYFIWILDETDVSITGGQTLDGITQGDGSHLVGEDITLTSNSWRQLFLEDDDANFNDNDNGQTLDGAQTVSGVNYADGTIVEAEYRFWVSDGTDSYEIIAVNIRNSSPAYGTNEAIAFIGGEGEFPPINVALEVTSAAEGPSGSSTPFETYAFPACFVRGTEIVTPTGPKAIETLAAGDLVITHDSGVEPIRWIGSTKYSQLRMQVNPDQRAICFAPNSLGPGVPEKPIKVSPQHRMICTDPQIHLCTGSVSSFIAAKTLMGRPGITQDIACETEYFHLLLDRHNLVFAHGCWSESYFPGNSALKALPKDQKAALFAAMPELEQDPASYGPLCRPMITWRENATIQPRFTNLPQSQPLQHTA